MKAAGLQDKAFDPAPPRLWAFLMRSHEGSSIESESIGHLGRQEHSRHSDGKRKERERESDHFIIEGDTQCCHFLWSGEQSALAAALLPRPEVL